MHSGPISLVSHLIISSKKRELIISVCVIIETVIIPKKLTNDFDEKSSLVLAHVHICTHFEILGYKESKCKINIRKD